MFINLYPFLSLGSLGSIWKSLKLAAQRLLLYGGQKRGEGNSIGKNSACQLFEAFPFGETQPASFQKYFPIGDYSACQLYKGFPYWEKLSLPAFRSNSLVEKTQPASFLKDFPIGKNSACQLFEVFPYWGKLSLLAI